MYIRPAPISDQRGFNLIEVLLAAGVLLLSMTGLLTVQMINIKISKNAYHRTQATNLAYEMTDYLRADCEALSRYTGQTLCRNGSRNPNDKRRCIIGGPKDVTADADSLVDDTLRSWWQAMDDAGLPFWYASIQPLGGELVRVVVQWDDSRATETAPDAAETKTSCLGGAIPTPMEEVCFTTDPCAD